MPVRASRVSTTGTARRTAPSSVRRCRRSRGACVLLLTAIARTLSSGLHDVYNSVRESSTCNVWHLSAFLTTVLAYPSCSRPVERHDHRPHHNSRHAGREFRVSSTSTALPRRRRVSARHQSSATAPSASSTPVDQILVDQGRATGGMPESATTRAQGCHARNHRCQGSLPRAGPGTSASSTSATRCWAAAPPSFDAGVLRGGHARSSNWNVVTPSRSVTTTPSRARASPPQWTVVRAGDVPITSDRGRLADQRGVLDPSSRTRCASRGVLRRLACVTSTASRSSTATSSRRTGLSPTPAGGSPSSCVISASRASSRSCTAHSGSLPRPGAEPARRRRGGCRLS